MKNVINKKYGRLTIIELLDIETNDNGYKKRYAICKCQCGKITKTNYYELRRKDKSRSIKSCGCSQIDSAKTHGFSSNKAYRTYNGMISRCYNTDSNDYKYYGDRGISICHEWLNDIKSFIDWFYSQDNSNGSEIDRIDNNGNYSPENCRLTSRSINIQNRRLFNKTSKYKGVSYHKGTMKWAARIYKFESNSAKDKHIGYYLKEEQAFKARSEYIKNNNLKI